MKGLSFLTIFLALNTFSEVKVAIDKNYYLKFENHNYALPLVRNTHLIKKKNNDTSTLIVTNNEIVPYNQKQLELFIHNLTGKKSYTIIKIGNKKFYRFYKNNELYFYSPEGRLIQVRGDRFKVKNISFVVEERS